MSSKAIKSKRDDRKYLSEDWQPVQEQAPSLIRGDEPTATRIIALFSVLFILMACLAMILRTAGFTNMLAAYFGGALGWFIVILGTGGLLVHAFVEKDIQYRRLYGGIGLLLLAAGVIFRIFPLGEQLVGTLFLPYGAMCLGLSLFFLVAFLNNEQDEDIRSVVLLILGIVGAVSLAIGLLVSIRYTNLQGTAFMHLFLGFLFVGLYAGLQPLESQRSYYAGLAIGALGGFMILLAILKLAFPSALNFLIKWQTGQPAAPFIFIYLGFEFLLLCLLMCSDNQLIVLTRREILSFMYSPVAYIILVTSVVFAFVGTFYTTNNLLEMSRPENYLRGGYWYLMEPIVSQYIISIFPFICGLFSVPIITMRLLSEEKRSGTMEVLLTAPVNETAVVLSKFFAVLRFYLLVWAPWAVFMVALQMEAGQEFDYRPLLVFFLVLIVTGSGFVSMGLFFSSLTRNQIAAAMLTFAGIIIFSSLAFLESSIEVEPWKSLLSYISFFNLWRQSLNGVFEPRFFLFHISLTIVFLFLTIKVLESRKWK